MTSSCRPMLFGVGSVLFEREPKGQSLVTDGPALVCLLVVCLVELEVGFVLR